MFPSLPRQVFTTEKGSISMIHPCEFTNEEYEIYSLEGDLFDDVERYPYHKEVMERINNLLNLNLNHENICCKEKLSGN
tara:strand:- start:70 stop:306 length:237 start_codon:yes stop_codon:yes gene_type:complete